MFSFDKNSLVKQLLYCSSPRCIFEIEINREGESERKVKERGKFPLLLFYICAIGNNIQDGNKFFFLRRDSLIQANKIDENSRFYKFANASKFVFSLKWH